jgi:pimeloyl-ACP methyl ester carboxylesterase
MRMNTTRLGTINQEAAFLPHQRVHNRLEKLVLEKVSTTGETVVHFPSKVRHYLQEKKLETLTKLDTRKLVYHLSPVKKLQVSALQLLCKTNPERAANLALCHFTKPRRRLSYTVCDLATPFTLPYRNGNLRGYSWGEGDKTVYLVHGWESLTLLMTNFVEPLLQEGFRVVAFDAPGHGHSDTQDTDVVDFSRALAHVIRHRGEAHGIIAHSCGGAATTLMLKHNPDITPHKVVLVAPMPSLQKHVEVFQELANLPANVFNHFIGGLEQRLGMNILEADAALAVQHVKAEGLVIHDLDDSLIPHTAGYWIAKNWQGSSLLTTTGLGHLNILQDGEVISKTVHFLTNQALHA